MLAMEKDGPEFMLLKSPEVVSHQRYTLLNPYLSGSSTSPTPEARRLQRSADRETTVAKSLLSTPIKMETEDEVYIIDGTPVLELTSGRGESPGSSISSFLGTESGSKASMSSGNGSSGRGNRKSKMCANWTRSGDCDYSPCTFPHSEEQLLPGIPNLNDTEVPTPSLGSRGASLSQYATPYRPFVFGSISYPSQPQPMLMPAAPNHQKPYYGSSNPTETGPIQVRQPIGNNREEELLSGIPNLNSPCKFPHSEEQLLSGIPNLNDTEVPTPSLSSRGASPSLSQYATTYRPFVFGSISDPSKLMPAAPIHQKPYYGSSNPTQTGPIQVRQLIGINRYAPIDTAPIKMKAHSEPITLPPVHEPVKVDPPSEHIDIQPTAESTPDLSVPTSPTFSYWMNIHPADPIRQTPVSKPLTEETPSQPINIQPHPTAYPLFSDWCPMDDGIHVTLPRNNTPSRDEVDDYMKRVLESNLKKKKLPAFEKICPRDD